MLRIYDINTFKRVIASVFVLNKRYLKTTKPDPLWYLRLIFVDIRGLYIVYKIAYVCKFT